MALLKQHFWSALQVLGLIVVTVGVFIGAGVAWGLVAAGVFMVAAATVSEFLAVVPAESTEEPSTSKADN